MNDRALKVVLQPAKSHSPICRLSDSFQYDWVGHAESTWVQAEISVVALYQVGSM